MDLIDTIDLNIGLVSPNHAPTVEDPYTTHMIILL